ncbi:putative tail protein [Vibrio phage 416E50-1]|nr:putative tail protein [Vibrio phage 416E50-1]
MSDRLIRYTLDGIKLTHDINFGVTDGDGFDVYVNRTKLAQGLDYDVIGSVGELRKGDGKITLKTAHAASDVLLILSDTLARRVTNFAKAARFEEAEIDNEFDNLLRLLEDASLYLTSTPYFNPVDIGLVDGQLPPVIAGGVLRVTQDKSGFELILLDELPELQEIIRQCTEQADRSEDEADKSKVSADKSEGEADRAQRIADALGIAPSGDYKGLWPDAGGSAQEGDTWQTQIGGAPTGQYFAALKDTNANPVNDDVNWREVISVGSFSKYTGIVYTASGGKSAFENMILGVPAATSVGGSCECENGTKFKRVSMSSGDINDFAITSEAIVNDFISPLSTDNTSEFDLAITKANSDNVPVSGRGSFVVNPSEHGIQVKIPIDFSLCEFKPTSKAGAGRVFEIVQDDFEDITALIDKSRMVKGAHRLYSITTDQPLNIEGFVMIETDTVALYRWNDNAWTPEYVKEPKTMGGYYGDLSTPLYFDYTSTSNLRIRVKKQMPNLEGKLGVWDISDSDFYTVCQVSRNDVTTTGPTIKERGNTTSSNLYTPIQNLYCNNTIFKGIKAGALGSEAVGGYAVLLNSCDNPHIEGMENRGGWGGVDGNYFARLTIEDSTAFAYSTHAFGWDISISNSYFYRVGSIHGGGKFIMYNCKMLSQALRDSYMNDYFIQTRVDYGSSWNGDIKVINCSVEPKNALSKFEVVFVNGAKTDASKRGVELNQMPNVTVENFKFRTVNPDSGNIQLNVFSTECTDTNKDWISYTKLPSKILISGIDADSEGGYIRMKSIRNQVDHTSGNYFIKNKDHINMSVSDVSFSADPTFARRWSELASVYGVETFAIPKSDGVKQKITIRNSDWHGVYIRTTESITVDAYDSVLIGPYRGFNSDGNIYNLDNDSRVSFNNCRLIKLWDLGAYFSSRILPTYFSNCIFDWQSYFTGSEAGYDAMYHETWKAQTQAVFNCSYAKARLSGSQDVVNTDLVARIQENYTNSAGLSAITTIKQAKA